MAETKIITLAKLLEVIRATGSPFEKAKLAQTAMDLMLAIMAEQHDEITNLKELIDAR